MTRNSIALATVAALILLPASAFAAIKFGRDVLKGTTRTMTFTADQQAGLVVEERVRRDLAPGKFSLEIDGMTVNGVRRVDGIEHEHEIVEYKDGEDGVMRTRPGNTRPGVITLTRDWSGSKEFANWRQAVINGKVERKSVSVVFHNDAGEESMRFNFLECWPVRYSGPALNTGGHETEELELMFDMYETK